MPLTRLGNRYLLIFVILALAIGAAWWWVPELLTPSHWSIVSKGAYGDSYGSLNALFAGLAFAGIIVTLLVQMAELQEQRKELRLTRKEVEGQKEQLKNQSETLQLQRFENTFFELQRVYRETMEDSEPIRGFWGEILNSLRKLAGQETDISSDSFGQALSEVQAASGIDSKDRFLASKVFDQLFSGQQSQSLTQLMQLVGFVHTSHAQDKNLYINSIVTQLDPFYVLKSLMCFGISRQGRAYKPLIERYGLLRNLTEPSPPAWNSGLYDPSAFKVPE